MANLFKFDDYSLIEVGTKYNQPNYQQISIDISNNHNIDRFQSLILVSIKQSNDVATYAVNNGFTFDSNYNALTMDIRLTNKDIYGSGSLGEQTNDFDYVIFYNSIIEDKYKFNNQSLFYSSVGLIDNFKYTYNDDYCYFIMPRTQQTNVRYTNIGVMLIHTDDNLTAYGKWKDSGNGGKGGGNYSGTDTFGMPANIAFLAINKNISFFTNINSPIIEVGISNTNTYGSATVNHNISSSDYIIILTPIVNNNTNEYISILYINKNSKQFSVKASYKDGSNNADGGGTKEITFYWGVIKKF